MSPARVCDHCATSATHGCTLHFKSVEIADEKSRYESFQGGALTTTTTTFRGARDETCWICSACIRSHLRDLTRASLQVPVTLMVLSGIPVLVFTQAAFAGAAITLPRGWSEWAITGAIALMFVGSPIVVLVGWLQRRAAVAAAITSGTLDENALGDSAWSGVVEEAARRALARRSVGSPRRAYSRGGFAVLLRNANP